VIVALRRWRAEDESLLFEARTDAYVASIESLGDARALERRIADRWAWVIEVEGDAVGAIGAARRHVPGLAELGYWVVERARGRGAATAAVGEASRWLLGEAGVERLQASVEPWNVASQRVLEANAFEREGASPRLRLVARRAARRVSLRPPCGSRHAGAG
jgi:RimJ/RimL family protein N-acetyltransferase